MKSNLNLKTEKISSAKINWTSLPKTYDVKTIKKLTAIHEQEQQKYLTQTLSKVESDMDSMLNLTAGIASAQDKTQEARIGKKMRTTTKSLSKEIFETPEAHKGHNPTFFAPFFNMGGFGVVGGITETVRFRNDTTRGQIAISVASYLPGGHVDRLTSQGAITLSSSSRNLDVFAEVHVGGLVAAFTLIGFARASATLVTSVTIGHGSRSETSHNEISLGDIYLGINRVPLSARTGHVRIPVQAGDLILASCGLRVTAGCGGLICSSTSNFAITLHQLICT